MSLIIKLFTMATIVIVVTVIARRFKKTQSEADSSRRGRSGDTNRPPVTKAGLPAVITRPPSTASANAEVKNPPSSNQFSSKARAALDRSKASNNGLEHSRAEDEAREAIREISTHLGRDHWMLAEAHNLLAEALFSQGKSLDARDHWDTAEMIAEEWPETCKAILVEIEKNQEKARRRMGF